MILLYRCTWTPASKVISHSTLWAVQHTTTIRKSDACVLCKRAARAANVHFPHSKRLQLSSSGPPRAPRDVTCNGSISCTSSSKVSTLWRATRGVFVSKLLRFRSRVDKEPAQTAFYRTLVTYKVDHNSGLERAKRKIETCGPAPIVVK